MEHKLIELTNKDEVCRTYEIYKHCMFMPTEEKFNKKSDLFFNNNSVKIFACLNQGKIIGVMVVSFIEQKKIEIVGIAVDVSARGKGVGSYMINQVVNNYDLLSVYAETKEQCEIKLAEMIAQKKAEIAEEKTKLKEGAE